MPTGRADRASSISAADDAAVTALAEASAKGRLKPGEFRASFEALLQTHPADRVERDEHGKKVSPRGERAADPPPPPPATEDDAGALQTNRFKLSAAVPLGTCLPTRRARRRHEHEARCADNSADAMRRGLRRQRVERALEV